jgi:hypothetical protein
MCCGGGGSRELLSFAMPSINAPAFQSGFSATPATHRNK